MAKCTIQVQTRDLRFRISSNFAKLIFKMSITIFVQNKCKNRLLTATVTSSSTSKMTKSVVKCIIQVQTRDLIVRITSNFGSITLHTKLIDSWKTAHQILFLTTAVTSLFTWKWTNLSWNALLETKFRISREYFMEILPALRALMG